MYKHRIGVDLTTHIHTHTLSLVLKSRPYQQHIQIGLKNVFETSPPVVFQTTISTSEILQVWPNWPTLFANMSNLTCSPTMLPNLATMLANKFRSKNVRGMFVHAENIFANICCSMECCLIWPLCSRTIQLIYVKVAAEICEKSFKLIVTSTSLVEKLILN